MTQTYLTTEELSERIKYTPRTIRVTLKDNVLVEGVHYIRPFGGRKILYIVKTELYQATFNTILKRIKLA